MDGQLPLDGLGTFQITWLALDHARDGEFIELYDGSKVISLTGGFLPGRA